MGEGDSRLFKLIYKIPLPFLRWKNIFKKKVYVEDVKTKQVHKGI